MYNELQDDSWLRQSFMVPQDRYLEQESLDEILTTAHFKFTDTTLGGNFAINPPPQFTRFADIKIRGRNTQSNGMGRYYSEALDDHGQYVHLRFGVPAFNSLAGFFFNFYNQKSATLARTGRADTAFYKVGRSIGFVVTLPLVPFVWANRAFRFIQEKPSSRFYYLKPAMALYWHAVSTMVNMIGVNMGVIARVMSDGEEALRGDDKNFQPGDSVKFAQAFSGLHTDIYRDDGGVDVFKLATRAQRMAVRDREQMEQILQSGGSLQALSENIKQVINQTVSDPGGTSTDAYMARYHSSVVTRPKDHQGTDKAEAEFTGHKFDKLSEDSAFGEHLRAEWEDGGAFVTFRVDDPGTVSESFSNTVGESEIASKINAMSSKARSTRFNLADGNLGEGLVLGTLSKALNSVTELFTGVTDELRLSGLSVLAGSSFVDIPKVWENSDVNMPSMDYTIKLRTPYGNPLSRFNNLVIPTAMILAGALPLSTGKQSYTSPFLVELYSKGRAQTRLGMFESITITRGTGNVGWTPDHEFLGVDITFRVIDLSSILHMPISSNLTTMGKAAMAAGEIAGRAMGTVASAMGANTTADGAEAIGAELAASMLTSNFDDDNAFTDYMAVLGSLSLADQVYATNKLRIRRAHTMAQWEQWKSPAHHASWLMGTAPARMIKSLTHFTGVTQGTARGDM